MDTIVCDLDSTLCDTSPRHGLQPSGPARHTNAGWREYSLACKDDIPIPATVALLRALEPSHNIVLLSARADAALDVTKEWLVTHDVPFDRLILRADHASTDPAEFKLRELRSLDAQHQISLIIDDYEVICRRVWEELHIPALHVHQPTTYAPASVGLPL